MFTKSLAVKCVILLFGLFQQISCGGKGSISSHIAAAQPPAAPDAPSLTADDAQIQASWSPVSGATAYEVWYHTSNNSNMARKFGSDVTDTSATTTGLSNDQIYYVWLKAKNKSGTSGFSPSGSATPQTPLQTVATPGFLPLDAATRPPVAPGAPGLSADNAQPFQVVTAPGFSPAVGNYTNAQSVTASLTWTRRVATPSFSPTAGTYTSAQSVTITCATSGASIHYTLDGSTPTESSATYASPIAVNTTTKIKAGAWKYGRTPSAIASATYSITPAKVATPSFSPVAGTYTSAQSVTITCSTLGATIHYTLDGSTPTESSAAYTSSINISSTTTIKAGAWKSGMNPSPIASATYTITTGTVAFGTGIAADTLANTQIGGTDNGPATRVSYRFTSNGGTLNAIRVFFETGSGYGGGTGGSRRITLETDDAGQPSGTVLAETTTSGLTRFPVLALSANLASGVPYHVVFTNTDAAPGANFVSANALYSWDETGQPSYPEWQVKINTGSGWSVRPRFLPILQLDMATGSEGIGYMECWQTNQPAIGGVQQVRERFTPERDLTVSAVGVRLKRDSGTGSSPLTLTLMAGSTVLGSATIPASTFPVGSQCDCSDNHNGWGNVALSVSLKAGTSYDLVLSSPADTIFRAEALRKGLDYGFSPGAFFAEGRMQQSGDGGASFSDVSDPSGGNAGQADLMFFLEVNKSQPGQLLFVGDFETGNISQWPTSCPSPSGIHTVTSPVRQGKFSAQITVNSGNRDACGWGGERSELATNKLAQGEGTEYYYAWSTYFPSDWQPVADWGVITQWHTKYDLNPAVSIIMENPVTGIQLALCAGNQDGYSNNCNPAGRSFHEIVSSIPKGKWIDFILHIKWSSANTGLVEVWCRVEGGTVFSKPVSLTNIPTLQTKNGEPGYITYMQQGLYRGATGNTQIIYHDGFRVGTTYDSVLYPVVP